MYYIDSCFNLNDIDYMDFNTIKKSPITQLIYRYRNYDKVLAHYEASEYDVKTIAAVFDAKEADIKSALLERFFFAAVRYMDDAPLYQKAAHIPLLLAYRHCLHTIV